MRALKRTLLVLGGLLLAVLVGVVLFLTFADLGRFRPRVESAITAALGRELRIAGEFRPEVFPTLSLVAGEITIANAGWGTPGPMLSIGRVRVEVGLWSLVAGPIRIKTLEVDDVAVLLEENDAGDVNWSRTTEAPPETVEEPAQGLPFIIERAAIHDVNVVLKRPGTEDFTAALAALDLHTDADEFLIVAASGQLGAVPFDVTGKAGPQEALEAGADVDIHLDADLDVIDATVEGTLTDNLRGARLSLKASSEDVGGLLRKLELPADLSGALQAEGELIVSPDPETPATVEISVSVPDLAGLGAGRPMPLKATAKGSVSAQRVDIDLLEIGLGESDFSGSLNVELGDRLAVVARGKSTLLDVTPFGEAAPPPDADAVAKKDVGAAPSEPRSGKWVFGEEPLPLRVPGKVSLEIEVSVAELRQADLELRDLELALRLEEGKAEVTTSFSTPEGGSAEGRATLALAGDGVDVAVNFDARDLRVNLASGELDDPTKIPPIGLSVSLRSSGASLRALASAANGRVAITQGAGLIKNNAVGFVSGGLVQQLFGALNPFAKKEKYSNWECTVLALTFVDGVGTLDPMLAQAEKLVIVGGGTIDLGKEKLKIEFNTKPRSGIGITADMFVTPFVKLGGTLAKPGIGLNKTGALLTGGTAVLTGGISLLLRGVADRATAEGDQCAEALAALRQGQ